MARVIVSVENQDVEHARFGDTTWVLYGGEDRDVSVLDRRVDPASMSDDFVRKHRTACLIFVTQHGDAPVAVGIRRGVFADDEIYYRQQGDELIIDDGFHNAVSRIPVADRQPSVDALVEHYLFRRAMAPLTYAASITGLPTASAVDFDLRTGDMVSRVIDRLDTDPEPRPVESHITEISEAIEDAVMRSIVPGDTTLFFSGGVDSTLLLTYAGDSVVPLTIVPDSPEFAAETGYATTAAALAGVGLHTVNAPESRYPELLADVIELLAAPAVHDLAPFELLGAEEAQGTIMVGTLADTLFGLQSRAMLAARWASTPILRATVEQAARLLPGSLGTRAGRVAARAAAVASDPLGIDGLGTVAYVFGDKHLVTGIAGEEAVRAALSRACERLHARVQAQTPLQQRLTANIELGHVVYMVTGAGGYQRVIARRAGKRIVGPYHAQSVIEAAWRVPAWERFLRDGDFKWIPKTLLERRLPGYDAFQEKKHTKLPVRRYYESGVLSDVWDKYELPDFLDDRARADVLGGFGPMAWNAMAHAIWRDRVGRNVDLSPYPPTVSLSWGDVTVSGMTP